MGESTDAELAAVAAKINALEPHERVELAAALLVNKQPKTALAILRKVVSELTALEMAGSLG